MQRSLNIALAFFALIFLTLICPAQNATYTPVVDQFGNVVAPPWLKTNFGMAGNLTFNTTSNGGLIVNSLTTAQRLTVTPTNGMIVWDNSMSEFFGYANGWTAFGSGGGIATNAIANFYPATLQGVSTNTGEDAYDWYFNVAGDGWNGTSNLFEIPSLDQGANRGNSLSGTFDQRAILNLTSIEYPKNQTNMSGILFTNEVAGLGILRTFPPWSTNLFNTNSYVAGTGGGNHSQEDGVLIQTAGRVDTGLEVDTYGGAINSALFEMLPNYGTAGSPLFNCFPMNGVTIASFYTNCDSEPFSVTTWGVPWAGSLVQINDFEGQAMALNGPYVTVTGAYTNGPKAYNGNFVALNIGGIINDFGESIQGNLTVTSNLVGNVFEGGQFTSQGNNAGYTWVDRNGGQGNYFYEDFGVSYLINTESGIVLQWQDSANGLIVQQNLTVNSNIVAGPIASQGYAAGMQNYDRDQAGNYFLSYMTNGLGALLDSFKGFIYTWSTNTGIVTFNYGVAGNGSGLTNLNASIGVGTNGMSPGNVYGFTNNGTAIAGVTPVLSGGGTGTVTSFVADSAGVILSVATATTTPTPTFNANTINWSKTPTNTLSGSSISSGQVQLASLTNVENWITNAASEGYVLQYHSGALQWLNTNWENGYVQAQTNTLWTAAGNLFQNGSTVLSNLVSQTAQVLNLGSATNYQSTNLIGKIDLTGASVSVANATNTTWDMSYDAVVYTNTNNINFASIKNLGGVSLPHTLFIHLRPSTNGQIATCTNSWSAAGWITNNANYSLSISNGDWLVSLTAIAQVTNGPLISIGGAPPSN